MRILLINPEDSFLEGKGDRPPLGLLYLSSWLKKHGHKPFIMDLNHTSAEEFMNKHGWEYGIICFSISTPNYDQCLEFAEMLEDSPSLLVAGGNHVTNYPNEERTLKAFDHVIVGDGEMPLLRLANGEKLPQVIPKEEIENIDDIPFPDRDAVDFANPLKYNMKIDGHRGAIVITSRGCTYSCAFCGSAKIKKIRYHSDKYVVSELLHIWDKYGIKNFYFADDIFTKDRQRVLDICRRMFNLMDADQLPDIKWRCTTRADLLDDELVNTMSFSGCSIISLGLESGNDQILKNIHKGMTVEQQREGVKLCQKYGIKVKGFFIIGLPGETRETALETIAFAKSLNIEWADFYPYTPVPGTYIWDRPKKYGMIIKKPEGSWADYYQVGKDQHELKGRPTGLTEAETWELIELAKKEVCTDGRTQ